MSQASDTPSAPPGGHGLPLLGETLEFVKNPGAFARKRRVRFGEIYTARVLGMRLVNLLTAEAHRWIFEGEHQYLQNKWSPGIRKLLGSQSLAMLNGEAHRARRRILAPHFTRVGLAPLVETMTETTDRHLKQWSESREVTVVERMKKLAFEIVARYLFADIDGLDLEAMADRFETWVQGFFTLLPVALPGTTFAKAMNARDELNAMVKAVVEQRRSSSERGADVLSSLFEVKDDKGASLSDDVIVDEIALLLFAGHDTTVTTTSNTILHLCQHPQVLERAREEQRQYRDAPDTLQTFRDMKYLEQVFSESMRVIPPINGAFRELTEDVTFADFFLKKGWIVTVNPHGPHQDPSVWTDPETFYPDRFSEARAEHKKHPFAYIPFGGGPRTCLGQHFAILEMQIVLSRLIRDYTFRLVENQDLSYMYLPFPRPKSGLRLTVQPTV